MKAGPEIYKSKERAINLRLKSAFELLVNRTRIHFSPWTCFYLQTFVLGEAQSWYSCLANTTETFLESREILLVYTQKISLPEPCTYADRRRKRLNLKLCDTQDGMYLNPFMWLLMKVLGHMVWFCIFTTFLLRT